MSGSSGHLDGQGKLPNFKRFYELSQVFTGVANMERAPYLEPWIQWYSMHTGLSYIQHQVFHLADGPRATHKDVWTLLIENGHTTASFASMNARSFRGRGLFSMCPIPGVTAKRLIRRN